QLAAMGALRIGRDARGPNGLLHRRGDLVDERMVHQAPRYVDDAVRAFLEHAELRRRRPSTDCQPRAEAIAEGRPFHHGRRREPRTGAQRRQRGARLASDAGLAEARTSRAGRTVRAPRPVGGRPHGARACRRRWRAVKPDLCVDFAVEPPYRASMADPTSRIVRLPGVRRARGLLPLASPVEVARRLAALERQVEKALGAPESRGMSWTALERVLDRSLDGYGLLRRALGGERMAAAEVAEGPLDVLYRWWWRIEVIGRERVPRRGPVLVVANRGGSLMPYEAFMLARAFTSGHDNGRIARPLADEWLMRLPVVGPALASLGALPATTAGARAALGAGALAIAFPEGL